jgi:hypothetical protein
MGQKGGWGLQQRRYGCGVLCTLGVRETCQHTFERPLSLFRYVSRCQDHDVGVAGIHSDEL